MNNHRSCKSHCCVHHGCKYGYEDCPVKTGAVIQDYPCEVCYDEVEDLHRGLHGLIAAVKTGSVPASLKPLLQELVVAVQST